MMEEAAIKLIKRAIELDSKKIYTEAKIYYQEGIQLLLNFKETIHDDDEKKKHLSVNISKYLSRAEMLKKHVKDQTNQGVYHEEITIEHNSTGHSYESVFGRFFDSEVTTIVLEDPYIRSYHQRCNFLRFCELAVKKCPNLTSVQLVTSEDPSKDEEQLRWLRDFKVEIDSRHKIDLSFEFSSTLHDRQIKLSNGWIIKIGRGLDYFQAPETKYSLGYFDLDLRPCHNTTVDIFHEKDVLKKNL